MIFGPDVITWTLVCVLWLGRQNAFAAPTSLSATETSSTPTSTPLYPSPNPDSSPPGTDPSTNSSSPMTTIIIVCVVGTLALFGAAWSIYTCRATRKQPPPTTIIGGTSTVAPTTAIVYMPGEIPAMAAVPSLCYNSPPTLTHPNTEATEVGPSFIIPPPPAYDAATGGRPFSGPDENMGTPLPYRPVRERTDSRWKDLLLSQGRD